MTYLMPDGRCVSGPPLAAAKPAPKTAKKVVPHSVQRKAKAASKGGRK
jgi:hypothetical protein